MGPTPSGFPGEGEERRGKGELGGREGEKERRREGEERRGGRS